MLSEFVKKLYTKLSFGQIVKPNAKIMSFEDQKEYLEQFPDPADDYERSYYKFKCWKKYFYQHRKMMLLLFNIGAMFMYPLIFLRLKRNNKSIKNSETYDAVVENVPRLPNDDVIPEEILETYQKRIEITSMNYLDGVIDENGRSICRELRKRYFFCFYFRLFSLLKLAQFEKYIREYSPKAIAFYSYEREFTGPLQTYLCELYGIDFISYMHGDLLYSIAFAFQRYSVLYIWGEEYRNLFKELKCTFTEKTYVPEKLKGIAKALDPEECDYFATYYFSAETRPSAEIIKKVFDTFREKNLKCKIRAHPRYSDNAMLKEVFADYDIEDTAATPLADSITQSLYIIGLNTTVLSQAFFSGKTVVIDDLSNTATYSELAKKQYVMLSRPHILLSELESMELNYNDTYRFVEKHI